VASRSRAAARYHGDQAAVPGTLDSAVDVRAAVLPSWLVEHLGARPADLGRRPGDQTPAVYWPVLVDAIAESLR
jgi:histidinol-phosphate aminotransferase